MPGVAFLSVIVCFVNLERVPSMARKRDLRYFASVSNAIIRLIAAAVFVALGWLAFAAFPNNTVYIGAKIIGGVIIVGFGLVTLRALVALVFRWVFRQPLIEMNEAGVTYRPSLTPWRRIDIPWDDVRLITFHQWGATSGRGAMPRSSFAIFAKHPNRYASSLLRRLFAWWNPALSGATVVVSASHVAGHRLKDRQRLINTIKATFASEIGRYGIAVNVSM